MDVTLQWDANTEPDLASYWVYYKTGSSGIDINDPGSYNVRSYVSLAEDENADPNTVEYTLNDLSNHEIYYFVVTAYDTEGLESQASNEVSTGTDRGSAAEAGCFIAAAAFGSNMGRHPRIFRLFSRHRYLP